MFDDQGVGAFQRTFCFFSGPYVDMFFVATTLSKVEEAICYENTSSMSYEPR